jgi:hypothetical protein
MPTSFEVAVRFWTDAKVRAVSPDAKLAMLYLMGQDGYGIFRFYQEVAAHETGLGAKRFRQALEELLAAELIRWDEERRLAWVVNRLRYRFPKGISVPQAKGLVRRLEDLPKESQLLRDFIAQYKGFLDTMPEGLGKGLTDSLGDANPNPSTRGSPTSSVLLPLSAVVGGERGASPPPDTLHGGNGLDPRLSALLSECPQLMLVASPESADFWDRVFGACQDVKAADAWLASKIRQWDQWFASHPSRRSRDRRKLEARLMGWLTRDLERLARMPT